MIVVDDHNRPRGVYLTLDEAAALAPTLIGHCPGDPLTADFHRVLKLQPAAMRRVVAGLRASTMDAWATVHTLSRQLGVSPQAVTKRCRTGTIRATKDDDGQWRISPEEVDRLLAS
jgi:hypothetical protein